MGLASPRSPQDRGREYGGLLMGVVPQASRDVRQQDVRQAHVAVTSARKSCSSMKPTPLLTAPESTSSRTPGRAMPGAGVTLTSRPH